MAAPSPPDAEPLHWLSIPELAESFRSHQLSPVDVTGAMLARIDRLDGDLHSYVTVTADEALDAAKRAEAELANGRDRGPLHGVPIAVKDLCDTRGVRTTAGTRVMRDRMPDADACVVERLRAAGAVMLGKLAMTEGAHAIHHPDVAVPTNPWNRDRWPGVSSSGSGVATAAGLCFAALGTDTGGSIRFPSAANGIVGIKPTYGRVPRHGIFPLAHSLDHVGPMARSVEDAALVLDAIAGHDPRDPTSLRAPAPGCAAGLEGGVRGLRIGVDESWCTRALADDVTGRVLASADVLRTEGADVRPVTVPEHTELVAAWDLVCAAEAAVAHEGLFPERASDYGPWLRTFLERGRELPAHAYARAHALRLEFAGRLTALFGDVDLLLCPSIGMRLPERNPPIRSPGDDDHPDADPRAIMRFTAPFDFSGSPTLSLPCGFSDDGMPVSLQLVARHLEEATLCRAARAYERATDWRARRPPLAGD